MASETYHFWPFLEISRSSIPLHYDAEALARANHCIRQGTERILRREQQIVLGLNSLVGRINMSLAQTGAACEPVPHRDSSRWFEQATLGIHELGEMSTTVQINALSLLRDSVPTKKGTQ